MGHYNESHIFHEPLMTRLYGGTGLEMTPLDKSAKEALRIIIWLHRQIRTMDDEYEIAMTRQRIADLKAERMDYVEHCWIHARFRRS